MARLVAIISMLHLVLISVVATQVESGNKISKEFRRSVDRLRNRGPSPPVSETMRFQIAAEGNKVSELCLHYSLHYCLIAWHSSEKGGNESTPEDNQQFFELIKPVFRNINFFSLAEQEDDPCCMFQIFMYQTNGRNEGYSPEFYFHKLTDFSSQGRVLNRVRAYYNEDLCVNIIYQVGFGTGELEMSGGDRRISRIYIFPPKSFPNVFMFQGANMVELLTFDWFKENYICMDQPWICQVDDEPPEFRIF